MNPLKSLNDYGQAVWLDFLARSFVADGRLARLVEADGLRGVTSNPAIFEKAIADTSEYDSAVAAAVSGGGGDLPVATLYERLAIEDIRAAADVLAPVHAATGGSDGFVSLEVSPYLALDAEGTIEEARRFWRDVDRPNLMVKVPATPPGIDAVRTLIGEGININVTLLFSQDVYEEIANAYLDGLETLAARNGDVAKIASVASFFVSRIDTAVDKLIDERIAAVNDPTEKALLGTLKGKVAIANAKLAYQRYKRLFSGERWAALSAKGARAQRLLWASTGTKNKAYSDVLYVEELIGENTVNTMPPATMDAFRDHGKLRASLEERVDAAQQVLIELSRCGVVLDDVTKRLVDEGVQLFADAADKLLGAVARKRAAALGTSLNRAAAVLPAGLGSAVAAEAERWRLNGSIRRLWQRDAALWTGSDEGRWLAWLTIVERELGAVAELEDFAARVKAEGFSDVLLIGMGGSSLGPEVLAQSYGQAPGWPKLRIIDSTDPAQIREVEAAIDLKKTLFIVASKSGSTLEPNVLKDYFFDRAGKALGRDLAGSRFVAITDPGSSMEKVARTDGFWKIFYGVPDIGGRYSILSRFGLVPAAASGIDVKSFLLSAREMVYSCGPDVPPGANPGLDLGLVLGVAALEGRDKVTLVASPQIADFGAWAEQLIAESTGKHGKAIIPVDGEPLGAPDIYGEDRIFVYLRLDEGADPAQEAAVAALEQAGQPVVRIALASPASLPQEFFRFEIATAVAGAVLGIHPFDQPDVEASKIRTRELTSAYESSGALPPESPVYADEVFALYADEANLEALREASASEGLDSFVKAHLSRIAPGDYFAILAYVARNAENAHLLEEARTSVLNGRHVATCLGFGPRFLHSTGQAYKGGPNSGLFLQITAEPGQDLAIPGRGYTFGTVEAAQARGDLDVLAERRRRYLRIHLKTDVTAGLIAVTQAVKRALS